MKRPVVLFVIIYSILLVFFNCVHDHTKLETDVGEEDVIIPVLLRTAHEKLTSSDKYIYELFKFAEGDEKFSINNNFTAILESKGDIDLAGIGFVYKFAYDNKNVSVESVKSVKSISLLDEIYTFELNDSFLGDTVYIKVGLMFKSDIFFIDAVPFYINTKVMKPTVLTLLSNIYNVNQDTKTVTIPSIILLSEFKSNVTVYVEGDIYAYNTLKEEVFNSNLIKNNYIIRLVKDGFPNVNYSVVIPETILSLLSNIYKVDEGAKSVTIPKEMLLSEFISNVSVKGEGDIHAYNILNNEILNSGILKHNYIIKLIKDGSPDVAYAVLMQPVQLKLLSNIYEVDEVSKTVTIKREILLSEFIDNVSVTNGGNIRAFDNLNNEIPNTDVIKNNFSIRLVKDGSLDVIYNVIYIPRISGFKYKYQIKGEFIILNKGIKVNDFAVASCAFSTSTGGVAIGDYELVDGDFVSEVVDQIQQKIYTVKIYEMVFNAISMTKSEIGNKTLSFAKSSYTYAEMSENFVLIEKNTWKIYTNTNIQVTNATDPVLETYYVIQTSSDGEYWVRIDFLK